MGGGGTRRRWEEDRRAGRGARKALWRGRDASAVEEGGALTGWGRDGRACVGAREGGGERSLKREGGWGGAVLMAVVGDSGAWAEEGGRRKR